VVKGSAAFELDGEEVKLERGDVLAVTDPGVRRRAKALSAGTMLLVVGSADDRFESTRKSAHLAEFPRPE